jgi:LmbE family N-acetylglucosaminyl deacetylase
MYTYKDIFQNKKRILFIMAHPDDIDVFFGGTIARLVEDRKEVRVLLATNGARGSRENDISESELAKIREEEQIKALKLYGVPKENFSTLNYPDGTVENNMEIIGEIVSVIRKYKPDIVCTHEPHGYYYRENGGFYINHRDHRMTGRSALDAVYPFSRDISFFKEQIANGDTPHTVTEMMFTFDRTVNTKIDITNLADTKRRALATHKSQMDKKTIEDIMNMFKEKEKYFEKGNYIKLAW